MHGLWGGGGGGGWLWVVSLHLYAIHMFFHARVVGKVSCLERWPPFRSVLIEGFHRIEHRKVYTCIYISCTLKCIINEQSSCSSEMSLLHKGTRYGIKTVGGKPIVNHVCMTYHGNQYSMHILIADLVVSTG